MKKWNSDLNFFIQFIDNLLATNFIIVKVYHRKSWFNDINHKSANFTVTWVTKFIMKSK